jgi:hypothetical protein
MYAIWHRTKPSRVIYLFHSKDRGKECGLCGLYVERVQSKLCSSLVEVGLMQVSVQIDDATGWTYCANILVEVIRWIRSEDLSFESVTI